MLYPHTITGTLSAGSDRVIRRNAALMPAYNLLLGLIALLGYVAIAAGVHTANSSSAVPLLLTTCFPPWFAGFCLAAIAIGALVPAAIMSIATANLFTRNLYGELVHRSFFSAAHDRRAGSSHGKTHLSGDQVGGACVCSAGAGSVCH